MLQRFAGVIASFLFVVNARAQEQPPLLAAIFSDHAVLQRDRPIEVWGRAQPGEQVTIALDNDTRKAQTDATGGWAVTFPAMRTGGTHTLTARTATRTQTVSDLLIGDVWLCSGQSNMEWTVRNALNAGWEAAHSADDQVRHVAIPRHAALAPRADFAAPLEWKVAGPDTTPDFSAVCYYFARELKRTVSVDVPQGLINSSWGGTRIETWLSQDALRQLGRDQPGLELLGQYAADRGAGSAAWGRELQKWWAAQPANQGVEPWSMGKSAGTWTPAPAKLTPWESWGVAALAEYDGMMWYRARVKLSAAQAKKAASVALEVIDDVDLVWINGQPIGSGEGENARVYRIPPRLLKAGENIVVVNAFDMWGSGGMHGKSAARAIRFEDGSSAPLSGWEYQMPPAGMSSMPRAPWEPYAGMNILYNAMIAPLRRYGLRGVAWYQGESNSSVPEGRQYQAQLAALMADWRRQFESPLPFLIVQLA
ncbi:MAG TPA: sialate O-acetylesterase, partial [Steroidobacteraceae bacterium]